MFSGLNQGSRVYILNKTNGIEFKIGEVVQLGSVEIFSKQLENFVNTFKEKAEIYKAGLIGANNKYSQENLLKSITGILSIK